MRLADIFRRARGAFRLTEQLFRLRERLAAAPGPKARRRTRLGCEAFEERVVPARPLPYPVFAVAPESGGAGIVKMYDAESGAELLSLRPFPEFTGGIRVAVADITRDTYPDLIVGAGPGGGPRVRVFDGKSGQPLSGTLGSFFAYSSTFTGGVQLASGDVTGDGVPDVLTAADTGGGPHVKVFDGTDGDEVDSFYAFESEFTGGVRLAAGDLTGDGVAEIVLGAGGGGAPRVRVLDASTLDPIDGPLGDFFAFDEEDRSGVYVAASDLSADVTGDGFQDLVVGAGEGRTADVVAYDSVSGDVAFTAVAFGSGYTGGARVGTLYADDDAYADIAVGSGPGVTPQVTVLNPLTGDPVAAWLGSFAAAVGTTAAGVNLAAGNDPPGGPGGGGVLPIHGYMTTGGSSAAILAGQRYDLRTRIHVDEGMVSAGVENTWEGGSVTTDGKAFSPKAYDWYPEGTPREHAYSSAGAYTVQVLGTAAGEPGYGGLEFNNTVNVTVVAPPPDLATGPATCEVPTNVKVKANAATGGGGPATTAGGVVAGDGSLAVAGPSLVAGGYGAVIGTATSWSTNVSYAASSNGGDGWADGGAVHLIRSEAATDTMVIISGAGDATYFDGQGSPDGDGNYPTYVARREKPGTLTFDSGTGTFVFDGGDGGLTVFNGFDAALVAGEQGAVVSRVEPGGATQAVTDRDALGRVTLLERTVTEGGVTTLEHYETEYLPASGTNIGRVWKQALKRQVNGGSWETVRTLEYLYYTPSEVGGTLGDLKRADLKDGSGTVLEQWYYRYDANGRMTHAVGTEAYGRLKAAAGGTDVDVEAASNGTVETYADLAIEYDGSGRVSSLTKSAAGCSMCSGGQGEFTYSYTTSGNSAGSNSWKTKVVETQPDGTTNTYYANALGGIMLTEHEESSLSWVSYTKFDSDYRPVLIAAPSAMTGYDDNYADLVNTVSNNAQYVADSAGLVSVMTYGSSTTATDTTAGNAEGFLSGSAIRQGETGTDVPQSAVTYFRKTAGDATTTVVAAQTRYVNDNGTGAETTSYAYTWQSGTVQPASITVTLPTVTTAQNGSNSATTATTVYDSYGRATWSKDQAGFISYTAYDTPTGAVVKQITDVDTTQTGTFANLPSGWTTPGGGGLHLTTAYEVDTLGRTTKATMPNGRVDYTVYNDVTREVRSYPGWDTGTDAPTGPTTVYREDRANNYVETLTMSATPAVSSGRPTGAESISSLQTLSRSVRNAVGQAVYSDAYFDLTGVTYAATTTLGTLNTNYYRTQTDYGKQSKPNRTVTALGTITRTEYDGLGRAVSQWVGTDDTPTTGFWSVSNTAGTDMVKVREYEYDGGGAGDSNLTEATEIPGGGAANRVTQTWYDWRNRAVAVKAGVESSEATDVNRPLTYSDYDNLGRIVTSRTYDADTVTPSVTGGVPQPLSGSLLRAKSTTAYDALGRAFRSSVYSVDPSSGTVSTYALHSNTWFDERGLTIKTASPGGLVQKTVYDGAGRTTTSYSTDGGGDSGYSDADDVTGDTVLEQSEMTYDGNGNVLTTALRRRFHDASGTGALGTPSAGVGARVSYMGYYYDKADRLTATADAGTNPVSGTPTAWTRPGSVPSRSDTVLVTSQTYDAAGRTYETTDPMGTVGRTLYDTLGRTTKTVQNYVDGTVSDGDDKTTEYTYNAAGMTSLTAKLTGGGVQTTDWVYGVTTGGGSAITSNDVVGATRWPDPSTGAASSGQQDTVTVNALGQTVTSEDRNGTEHTFTYDVLGRVTADAVTALGSGVDGTVMLIGTEYDGQGNAYRVTSYDAVTSGAVVNQLQRAYNGLGQLVTEWQAVSGSVNTSTTPKVQYAYTEMASGANHSRPTSMTYPSGYVLTSNYASGLNAGISRLTSLSDSTATVEGYEYLGLGTLVKRTHPQSGADLSYVKLALESNGDGGDQYAGLDRFGRVVDQRWVDGTGSDLDREKYGYDRAGNRLYADNQLNNSFDELYHANGASAGYDGLYQLTAFRRGALSDSNSDGVPDTVSTASRTQVWDFDAVGNMESVTTDGVAQTRTHNKQNEITGISGATTPTYDAAGNMTADESGTTFSYDAWGRVIEVNGTARYAYDGVNRRIAEGSRALYYTASWQVVEERASGVAVVRNVWSPAYIDGLVLRDRDSDANGSLEERLYALQDGNWNVQAVVGTDSLVKERYAFDPYGSRTVLTAAWAGTTTGYAWVLGHQGGRLDAATGMYAFRYRDFSSTLLRWNRNDPIAYMGNDALLYRYERNSSIATIDPSGLVDTPVDSDSAWIAALAEMLGYIPSADQMQAASNGCVGLCKMMFNTDFKMPHLQSRCFRFGKFPNYVDIARLNDWASANLKCPKGLVPRIFMVQFHGYIKDRDRKDVLVPGYWGRNRPYEIDPAAMDTAGVTTPANPNMSNVNFDFLLFYDFPGSPGHHFWLHMSHSRSRPGAVVKRSTFDGIENQCSASFEEHVVCVRCGPPTAWYKLAAGARDTLVYTQTVPKPLK